MDTDTLTYTCVHSNWFPPQKHQWIPCITVAQHCWLQLHHCPKSGHVHTRLLVIQYQPQNSNLQPLQQTWPTPYLCYSYERFHVNGIVYIRFSPSNDPLPQGSSGTFSLRSKMLNIVFRRRHPPAKRHQILRSAKHLLPYLCFSSPFSATTRLFDR